MKIFDIAYFFDKISGFDPFIRYMHRLDTENSNTSKLTFLLKIMKFY